MSSKVTRKQSQMHPWKSSCDGGACGLAGDPEGYGPSEQTFKDRTFVSLTWSAEHPLPQNQNFWVISDALLLPCGSRSVTVVLVM